MLSAGEGTLSLYTSMSVCNYYMTIEKANIVIIKKKYRGGVISKVFADYI